MILFYEREPHVKCYWEPDLRAVRLEWDRLFGDLDVCIAICEHVLDKVIEEKATVWIADTSAAKGVFSDEFQGYIKDILIPKAIQAGVRYVLTVEPQTSALARLSNTRWQRPVIQAGITTGNFPTLNDCKAWIRRNIR